MTQVLQLFDTAGSASLFYATDGNLSMAGGLETVVNNSLFTNKRAPGHITSVEPNGWWADEPDYQIGSHLYLLRRAPFTTETLRLAESYSKEALAWLVADKLAKSVSVTAEAYSKDVLALGIQIVDPGGKLFEKLWRKHRDGL